MGVAAHGSLPDVGVDAIAMMGPVLTGLAGLDHELRHGPPHALLGTGSVHASLIEGGQELSSYPQRCTVGIERRTVPGETQEQVEMEITSLLEASVSHVLPFRAEQRTLLVREPFTVSLNEPIVQMAQRELERVRGEAPPVSGAFGWMDSALLSAAGIPTVILGPDGEGAHADEEWVDLPSALATADALAGIVRSFCA